MLQATVKSEIISHLDGLTLDQLQKVLEHVRFVGSQLPPGMPGPEFRKFVGLIPKEDLAAMAAAIEEDCERIEPDESDKPIFPD